MGDCLLVWYGEVVLVDGILFGFVDLDEFILIGELVICYCLVVDVICSGVLNVGVVFEMIVSVFVERSMFVGVVWLVSVV